MRKFIFLFVLMLNLTGIYAQIGISGGLNMLKGFGVPKPYAGAHFGVEIPRDDQVSFFGRISTYLPNTATPDGFNYTYVTARDPATTSPYQQQVYYDTKFNYTVIEGGSRYYLGDGYDSGFGAYGGSNFSIAFNSVKRIYGSYDEVKYVLPSTELPKGSIFNFGFGLNGGVKNTFAGIGTLYLDLGFSYLIPLQASNTTASAGYNTMGSQLCFTFNLGFRKELY